MAIVYQSDLTGGAISGMVSALESEEQSVSNLLAAISSFVNDSTSSLVGEGYNAARTKMGLYVTDINSRKKIAADLASAITSGAASLAGYMSEYSMLDTDQIPEIEEKIRQLKTQIQNAYNTISRLVANAKPGQRIDVSGYYSSINSWNATVKELEKKLEKLVGLGDADGAAFGSVQGLAGDVSKYAASVEGIQVSSIYVE